MALHLSIDLVHREIIYGGQVSATWVPLARSICFGLSFATFLTLIATPSMLALPLRLKQIYWRWRGKPMPLDAPPHVRSVPQGGAPLPVDPAPNAAD